MLHAQIQKCFFSSPPFHFLTNYSRYILHTICAQIRATPLKQHKSISNTDERSKLVYHENKIIQIKTNYKNKDERGNKILTFCISKITVSFLPPPRSSTFTSHCRNRVQFLLFYLSITSHAIGNICSSASLPTATNS